jgi:hypothetical protein
MAEERRAAPRFTIPDGVQADIGGIAVRLVELSMVGAKIEHLERFPLVAPQLSIHWQGRRATLPVRVARSEIVGKREGRLLYHSGLFILSTDSASQGLISSILRDPDAAPQETQIAPVPKPSVELNDDTWTRKVRFMRHELDDELPFVQFRLTPTGWRKEYVSTHAQPDDGFTITRDRRDFDELQRTFEAADPDTRRMMQIALQSQGG